MTFIQSAILGLVQGLTEFIPVSSTGHLILARKLIGLPLEGTLSFDAILQLATGLAVLLYFWKDILNLIKTFFSLSVWKRLFTKKDNGAEPETDKKSLVLLWAIIFGTIPAIVFGLLLQDYMDTVFRGTRVVAISLIIGAGLFFFAEKMAKQNKELSIKKGLIVGLFQCLALVPGISRSGSTISGGLFLNLTRESATRFSFLLSLPIIFGSGLKKFFDVLQMGDLAQIESSLFIASFFAFISGLLAIHFLLKFIKNHSLNYFGLYRVLLAIVILWYL